MTSSLPIVPWTKFTGVGAVCGAIRYDTCGEPLRVTVCHCTWCQRRTGSAFAVEPIFLKSQLHIASNDIRKYRYTSDESGRWIELNFCPTCGTNIGFELEVASDSYAVDAGTFDDSNWIEPEKHLFRHIFLRSAQNWHQVADDAEKYEKQFRAWNITGFELIGVVRLTPADFICTLSTVLDFPITRFALLIAPTDAGRSNLIVLSDKTPSQIVRVMSAGNVNSGSMCET